MLGALIPVGFKTTLGGASFTSRRPSFFVADKGMERYNIGTSKKSSYMAKPKEKLAIFDIDGTVFRSSLLIELINGLVKYNVFPGIAQKELEAEYLAWLDRRGSYEEYLAKVIKIHLKYIKGCRVDAVEVVANEVVKNMKNRVYRYTRDLIKSLKRKKYRLITISGSPAYIVSKFARTLGFDAAFGSEYLIQNGAFVDKVTNPEVFAGKDKVLKKFLADHNISPDLKKSVAVGDTESDIAMLKLVGRPLAFNPNLHLARYAKRHGWEIVVERKDVMYALKNFSFKD